MFYKVLTRHKIQLVDLGIKRLEDRLVMSEDTKHSYLYLYEPPEGTQVEGCTVILRGACLCSDDPLEKVFLDPNQRMFLEMAESLSAAGQIVILVDPYQASVSSLNEVQNQVSEVVAFISKFQLGGSVNVIGHSFGALAAANAIAKGFFNPLNVDKCLLLSPVPIKEMALGIINRQNQILNHQNRKKPDEPIIPDFSDIAGLIKATELGLGQSYNFGAIGEVPFLTIVSLLKEYFPDYKNIQYYDPILRRIDDNQPDPNNPRKISESWMMDLDLPRTQTGVIIPAEDSFLQNSFGLVKHLKQYRNPYAVGMATKPTSFPQFTLKTGHDYRDSLPQLVAYASNFISQGNFVLPGDATGQSILLGTADTAIMKQRSSRTSR